LNQGEKNRYANCSDMVTTCTGNCAALQRWLDALADKAGAVIKAASKSLAALGDYR
jgi:hypothetical protein